MNQGMLLESLNLAAAWELPVLFVCKDDGWAITTQPQDTHRGSMGERVRGLGVRYFDADGLDVEDVWLAAGNALEGARTGQGPAFLHARCVHLEAHFLGLPLLKIARKPVSGLPPLAVPLTRSFVRRGGAPRSQRLACLGDLMSCIADSRRDPRGRPENDPVNRTRSVLLADDRRLAELEAQIDAEIAEMLDSLALGPSA